MKVPMLAYFPDVATRNSVAQAAIEASKEVRLVGEAKLVVRGESSRGAVQFIIFFGDATDGLFFSEAKATFVGPLH